MKTFDVICKTCGKYFATSVRFNHAITVTKNHKFDNHSHDVLTVNGGKKNFTPQAVLAHHHDSGRRS